jgi:hypothetical protein
VDHGRIGFRYSGRAIDCLFSIVSRQVLEITQPHIAWVLGVKESFRPLYALGFTQPLTEMSTRNIKIIMFLGSKLRRVRKADNLTAICVPIVYTMWDP